MIYIITLPAVWDISKPDIARAFDLSEQTIQRYISNLRETGYLRYINVQDDTGSFAGGYYETIPKRCKG